MPKQSCSVGVTLWMLAACATTAAAAEAQSPEARITELANRFAALRVSYDPTLAYVSGLPAPDHSRLPDRTPRAIRALEREEDAISASLQRVPAAATLTPSANATRAVLREMLESSKQLRVCKAELWDLSHFTGWQVAFALVAEIQPVGTPALRAEALKRWASLPQYLEVQTANLRAGLRAGYSVPKPVVNRVIQQLDGLATAPTDSPFYSLAARDTDEHFKAQVQALIAERIDPAVRRFRVFLAKDYLPHARETLAVTALPDGPACYQALLRSYTTLNRTPAEVMALGERTVAENERAVVELGSRLYGSSDVAEILRQNNVAPGNHFHSPEELLTSVRGLLEVALQKTRPYFLKLPDQPVVIEPAPAYQAGTGISAHYEMQPDVSKPGRYIEPTEEWSSTTRGTAEITLVHEAVPGHHLQIALAREFPQGSDLAKLADNSAYVEGWARYAERLSEEAGIYQTDYARISRRIWPARGMVVDPGIHAFGWSREKAVAYLVATGRFDARGAEAAVDRIATIPGQLTAYDSGGLEIFALRSEAEQALGARFDVRQFHQRVLEQGIVPLQELRDHVHAWIAQEQAAGGTR